MIMMVMMILDFTYQGHTGSSTFHTSSKGLTAHNEGARTRAQIQGDFGVHNIILLSHAFKEGH